MHRVAGPPVVFNLAVGNHTPTGSADSWLQPELDAKTGALVRLGALVAVGGCAVPSFGEQVDTALDAGASVSDVVDVLLAVLPIVGTAHVVAAAPRLALSLGHDIDEVPDFPLAPS